MQLLRAEHGEHHQLVEFGAAARDAHAVADDGLAAVAADDVVGLDDLAAGAVLGRDLDRDAVGGLGDAAGGPAEALRDIRQAVHAGAQHLFHLVLRQPLVLLEEILGDDLAARGRVPVGAQQMAVGRELADRIARRHHAGGAQFVGDAPEMEVLQRALGQVLALRDVRQSRRGARRSGRRCRGARDRRRGRRRPGRRRR